MNVLDFDEQLQWSQGQTKESHPETIKSLLAGCVAVTKAPVELDVAGIDYVATLRRGATVNIDVKARSAGCSQYWDDGEPELALEIWSVVPEDGLRGSAGWTLDEGKLTDYTLHVFDPSDTTQSFLLPFQLLRMAFRRHLTMWRSVYDVHYQRSHRHGRNWRSQCVMVPAVRVLSAVTCEMRVSP